MLERNCDPYCTGSRYLEVRGYFWERCWLYQWGVGHARQTKCGKKILIGVVHFLSPSYSRFYPKFFLAPLVLLSREEHINLLCFAAVDYGVERVPYQFILSPLAVELRKLPFNPFLLRGGHIWPQTFFWMFILAKLLKLHCSSFVKLL